MSTSIATSFIRQYEADVKDVFQREGGYLRNSVRMKTGIVGLSTTFQKSGKGTATTKARHGVVTPMNQDHTSVTCAIEDFYAPDYVDKLDEAKTNIDERMVIARGGAWALGRKVDSQIITALDTTTQSTATITVTSIAAIRGAVAGWVEALWALDVPNDGQVFGLITPRCWSQFQMMPEFSESTYVGADGQPWRVGMPTKGAYRSWNGVNWMMHTGLPGLGTATAKCFIYHKSAVGYATGAHAQNNAENDAVRADVWWDGSRQAHLITHAMSGGAVLIDDSGVIEGNLNDTTAIATS